MNIIPETGQRALIVGKTGSGKTSFFTWLAKFIKSAPLIIYDTKIEPKFAALPNSIIVETMQQAAEVVEGGEHDYIVVRPGIDIVDNPVALDNMLLYHYHHFQGLPAYIDEAMSFHRNSRALRGLTALMTRGRSKGITTILSSQLPRYISAFCMTEIDHAFIFRLQHKEDRKRIEFLIPDFTSKPIAAPHHFYYFDNAAMDEPVLMSPVKLDRNVEQGYVDADANLVPVSKRAKIWI